MEEKRVKLRGIRKTIALRMKKTCDEIPMGYSTMRLDMTNMRQMQQEYAEKGTKLSDSVFFIRAATMTVQKYPAFNARSESTLEAVYYDQINPGLAIDSERGLIVLAFKDTGDMPLLALSKYFRSKMKALKEGTLTPDDYTGATFSISSLSKTSIHSIGPLVNNGECFILGLGGIQKEPVVTDDGSIAVRDVCYVTLTNNHLLVDGADCTRFLEEFKRLMENPSALL